MKKFDPQYQSFESHTLSLSKHYYLDPLENRTLLIDRPRYNFQQSLWIAFAYILRSKIEKCFFDDKVLVIAEERKVFEINTQKILNPAYWSQIISLKNFGTIDEGDSLYGTIYLKKIKEFSIETPEQHKKTGIRFFDRLHCEIENYVVNSIGLEKLKDARTKNREIEDMVKQNFPELTLIFIREFVSYIRRDLR